ncbi:unnamed protein product [Cuscuta epithymum]|uniref:Water stress and hypersensitive response domain-containing protein n=1 Tax=Cuscuta epithymum TaxID=186058 RepID=A0AAV0D690_9ASTE|nr:unnamed protein product [Cuscuta epithymum]
MDLIDKATQFVGEKLSEIPMPEASIADVNIGGISFGSVSYQAIVNVKNPYPLPIPICEIQYVLKSATREIASGIIRDPGSLKAKDTTVLDVPVNVPHSVLVSVMKDIGRDWDIDYLLQLKLIIDLPVVGNITIPLTRSGEVKLPTISDMWKKSEVVEEV